MKEPCCWIFEKGRSFLCQRYAQNLDETQMKHGHKHLLKRNVIGETFWMALVSQGNPLSAGGESKFLFKNITFFLFLVPLKIETFAHKLFEDYTTIQLVCIVFFSE